MRTVIQAFHSRRRTLLALVLTLSLLSGVAGTQTACNESDLQKTAEAAKDIGGGARDVIKAVGNAYSAGLITIEQKDEYADLLSKIAKGGQKGVDAIELLRNQGVTKPDATQRAALSHIFDDDVVAPFLEFLTRIGKLSNESSVAIRAALASVRTAIVLLSSRIGRNDVIKQIQAREVWNA